MKNFKPYNDNFEILDIASLIMRENIEYRDNGNRFDSMSPEQWYACHANSVITDTITISKGLFLKFRFKDDSTVCAKIAEPLYSDDLP